MFHCIVKHDLQENVKQLILSFAFCVCLFVHRWTHRSLLSDWTSQRLWRRLYQDHSRWVPLWKILHPQRRQDLDQVRESPPGGSTVWNGEKLLVCSPDLIILFLPSAMEAWLRFSRCSPRRPWRTRRPGRWRTRSQPSSWRGALEEWHSENAFFFYFSDCESLNCDVSQLWMTRWSFEVETRTC